MTMSSPSMTVGLVAAARLLCKYRCRAYTTS